LKSASIVLAICGWPLSRISVLVRTEIVVVRPDSAANAFVSVGGFSSADAESLIAFRSGR
jgi:hypothetical protein